MPDLNPRSEDDWQLSAEWITLCIRWFGLIIGYLVVNFFSDPASRPNLNAILTVGAGYAVFDLAWHQKGSAFLGHFPLFVSLMEAIFIGLLCHFDKGLESPFRYYYFLSLLVCAIRYSPRVTYTTLLFHALSFATLAFTIGTESSDDIITLVLMLVFMGWVTWASTSLSLLLREVGQKYSELNRDLERRISERTRELQQSQAMLVQQEKQAAFGLLAAGIAHEVGNPLTAISSLVQMMNRKPLEPDMHERLGLIDEQLLRIQRTLRELIEFSRPATGELQTVDVIEVINKALNIAKYYKRKKGRRITTEFPEELPKVKAVADQLLQVFLNLILNALDATEEGGTILIIAKRCGEGVCVTVKDDGHGIPEAKKEQLFEPYFTTKPTGTGLGLFVSRHVLKSMNGSITLVESSPAGSSFRVELH